MIRQITISGLLSFGPKGVSLPLGNLNVLIGPNGSGKSNFLQILNLLKAAPVNLATPIKETGGVEEWLWKGESSLRKGTVEVLIPTPFVKRYGKAGIRHALEIGEHGRRFEITDERIEWEDAHPDSTANDFYYRYQNGSPVLNEFVPNKVRYERRLKRENIDPEQSVLSQLKDPERYPELTRLQGLYESMQLFQNWEFGPGAMIRKEQSTHGRGNSLSDKGTNLPLVLSKILPKIKKEFLEAVSGLFHGIQGVHFEFSGGNVLLFLEEEGGRMIPATRLSDGTLRYLCLLAILLHPEPPPLIALEEPELGMHPDLILRVADLLVKASHKTQLVITTHSRLLIDALGEDPSRVIVCSKEDGETSMRLLDSAALGDWLKDYTLGELWSMGELGGNRW